jgi:DNA-binding transcriptional regulator/RsmH inhibitor MraZ
MLTCDSANGGIDAPTLVHALSPQSLILATDSGALHIYDIREHSAMTIQKPHATHRPHDDYVSSLTPLPPTEASTSGFSKQWVTTGGSTLAVTDLRRGVMVRSEDQEEELLSSIMVTGLSKKGTSVGEKVLVGGGNGVLTLWERGVWDDQDERITVDKSKGGGESLDVITLVPDGVGPGGKIAAVGLGNGALRFVKLGQNKVIAELKHDELAQEGVIGLGFDVTGRMISGGGRKFNVWGEKTWQDVDEDEEEEEEEAPENGKRGHESDSEKESDEEMESSSEDEEPKQKRKKRKKGKGGKQAKGHGILQFSGLKYQLVTNRKQTETSRTRRWVVDIPFSVANIASKSPRTAKYVIRSWSVLVTVYYLVVVSGGFLIER